MRERLSRRELLRISALIRVGLTGWGLVGSCDSDDNGRGNDGGLFGGGNNSAEGSAGVVLASSARLPEPFTVPLPIPPVLKPVRTTSDTDYYEITQRVARQEILPGVKTEVWGYDGIFPGPTILSRRGRRTVVTHRNELPVPTVVHLHGGRTPAEHDGYPTDLVLPVGGWRHGDHHGGGNVSQDSKEYVYPLDQPAATLWYHDHRMDFTGPQVYKGLAGFHLVHDDVEDALPLPRGEREVPLMIADRAFAADGAFDYPSLDPTLRDQPASRRSFMSGVLGDCVLVNGAPWPVLEVTNTRYRFRLLNASNARRYRLALDPPPPNGPAFAQIGCGRRAALRASRPTADRHRAGRTVRRARGLRPVRGRRRDHAGQRVRCGRVCAGDAFRRRPFRTGGQRRAGADGGDSPTVQGRTRWSSATSTSTATARTSGR